MYTKMTQKRNAYSQFVEGNFVVARLERVTTTNSSLEQSEEWHEMVRDYKEGNVDEIGDDFGYMNTRIAQMIGGRKAFVSESGHCGLVPDHAEIRDFICVLLGCDVPVILRQVEDHYNFIGESCVRGLMEGQAIGALDRGDVHLQDFGVW
jgi:hypothetical protein